MKNIILIATLLIFAACSNDDTKSSTKKEIEQKVQKKEVTTKVDKKETIKEKELVKTAKSGEELFQQCAACHGAKADKPALGKSQIIRGWDASKTQAALNGYNNGTYGGAMKALMIGQVGFLTKEEIKTVSEYISKL